MWNAQPQFDIQATIWAYLDSGDSDASNELLTHDYSPYIEELAQPEPIGSGNCKYIHLISLRFIQIGLSI